MPAVMNVFAGIFFLFAFIIELCEVVCGSRAFGAFGSSLSTFP